MKICRI